MQVAKAWNKTLACVECGSWDASWTSRFAGHDVEHDGDLSQWCPKCSKVFDVMLQDWMENLKVKINPDDTEWRQRKHWYHTGSLSWWEDCPDNVMVHVGHKDTSMWLARAENKKALYKVQIVKDIPKRLCKDQVDGWGNYSLSYVNSWEFPGRVSLYLPKSRLEIVDKEVL